MAEYSVKVVIEKIGDIEVCKVFGPVVSNNPKDAIQSILTQHKEVKLGDIKEVSFETRY